MSHTVDQHRKFVQARIADVRADCPGYAEHVAAAQALALADAADGLLACPNLFQLGNFTLNSGAKAAWKIECDALTSRDWDALARMAADVLPPFGSVWGVPRGGLPFAAALDKYATCDCGGPRAAHARGEFHTFSAHRYPALVCEDVCTTGGSMERFVAGAKAAANSGGTFPENYIGVCVFARDRYPTWVTPLFKMPNTYTVPDDGE